MRIKPKKRTQRTSHLHYYFLFEKKNFTRLNTLTFLLKRFVSSTQVVLAEILFSLPLLIIVRVLISQYRWSRYCCCFVWTSHKWNFLSCIVGKCGERWCRLGRNGNQKCFYHFSLRGIFVRWSNFYHRHQYTNECTKSSKLSRVRGGIVVW